MTNTRSQSTLMDDIVPDPQEIVGLTQAQSNQIFALQKKKAEAEAKAAEAEARIAESKALVAEKEVEKMQLEIDCMRREGGGKNAARNRLHAPRI